MGINEKRLGLGVHYISTKPLLDKIKAANLPTPISTEKYKEGG